MKKHTTLLLTTISIALCVLLSILMIEVIRYKEDAFVNYGAAMIIPGILFIFFLGIWIYFALQLPKEKRSFLFSKLFLVGWGVYILALLFVVFRGFSFDSVSTDFSLFKDRITYSNFVPFQVFKDYSHYSNPVMFFQQLIGNMVLLVPFGILTPLIFPKCKKTLNFVITSLATICTIEIVQLVLWVGNFDIDDVILNFSGAMIAFGILKLFEFMINTKNKERFSI